MSFLPANLYSAEQTRNLDRLAAARIDPAHAPSLMERAGAAAFTVLRRQWPDAQRIAVLCGGGNNGGDGFVVARLAAQAGMVVTVYLLTDPTRIRGDALDAWQKLQGQGVTVESYNGQSLADYQLLVDAMLGTGLNQPLSSTWVQAVNTVNQSHVAVLALDIPTGLHADSGRILGVAVCATVTITFIALKQGMLTAQGPDCCGQILFDGLDVPGEVYAQVPATIERVSASHDLTFPSRRSRDSHKGQYGHVVLIGGNHGMAGALQLAGQAALRCGAGLVSLATRQHTTAFIGWPELMVHGVEDRKSLHPLTAKASVLAIGPGLGQEPWSIALLDEALQTSLPLIMDADALNLLAESPMRSDRWVLTPHPGEAARLLHCSNADIQADRYGAVRALQDQYGGIVVLKGQGSLIKGEDEKIYLCDAGNPGMASAGMGDVLTGIIAGLLAQATSLSLVPIQCVALAVRLHAQAGDIAAANGERGMIASDLFDPLRRLLNPELRS